MATGVIYLQKDKFDIYSLSTAKLYEFRFVPEIISDLEVMNVDLLENLIKLFITTNKIPSDNFIIVVSDNACFIKDFVIPHVAQAALPVLAPQLPDHPVPTFDHPNTDELQNITKEYIEHVPFDKVVSRNIPIQNGTKVIAVNQDLCESIQKAFEKLGFKISSILPGIVFGGGLSGKPVLDVVMANTFIQQSDSVREYDLLNQAAFVAVTKQDEESDKHMDEVKPDKKSNKRLFVMLGTFAFLIVILILVWVINPNK